MKYHLWTTAVLLLLLVYLGMTEASINVRHHDTEVSPEREEEIRQVVGKILRETLDTIVDFLTTGIHEVDRYMLRITYPVVASAEILIKETTRKVNSLVSDGRNYMIIENQKEIVELVSEAADTFSAECAKYADMRHEYVEAIESAFDVMCTKLGKDLRIVPEPSV